MVTAIEGAAGSFHLTNCIRSYATPRWGTDVVPASHTWTICQAARATSAMPIYFEPLQIGSHEFRDPAAFGFNNPTMDALREASIRWPVDTHEHVVINLGTELSSLVLRSRGYNEVAARLHRRAGYTFDTPISSEEFSLSKLLWSVAVETQAIDNELENCFTTW